MTKINPKHLSGIELLQDCLAYEEYLTGLYNYSIADVVSNDLRSDLVNIMNEEHQFLSSVYRTLEHRGIKNTPLAAPENIRQVQETYMQRMQ